MPENSLFNLHIPETDVLSWLFPEGKSPCKKPIWIDSERPKEHSLSPEQLLQWVKMLGFGLDKLGVQQNEVVMVLSTNHIFVPVAYLGIAGHGHVFSGCNPAYTVDGKYPTHQINA